MKFTAKDIEEKVKMMCVTEENLCKYAIQFDTYLPDARTCELDCPEFPYKCKRFQKQV